MSYKIISKFIKDISFEIPDARTFVMLEKEISKYNLNFDIKSKPLKENIIEVNTILSLVPNQDVKHKVLTEINLATLISIPLIMGTVGGANYMIDNFTSWNIELTVAPILFIWLTLLSGIISVLGSYRAVSGIMK